MARNDNPHAIRLIDSLRQKAGAKAAKEFDETHALSKSANIKKKFEWAKEVCTYLEAHYGEETIVRIRKECRCNDGKAIANKLLKYLNKAESIKQFVDDFNQQESFAFLEYKTENKIVFCYPECYCACVKRVPEELSRTWCYCTLGNAEEIFKKVFGKEVRVSLLESIKTGAEHCAIEVEIEGETQAK